MNAIFKRIGAAAIAAAVAMGTTAVLGSSQEVALVDVQQDTNTAPITIDYGDGTPVALDLTKGATISQSCTITVSQDCTLSKPITITGSAQVNIVGNDKTVTIPNTIKGTAFFVESGASLTINDLIINDAYYNCIENSGTLKLLGNSKLICSAPHQWSYNYGAIVNKSGGSAEIDCAGIESNVCILINEAHADAEIKRGNIVSTSWTFNNSGTLKILGGTIKGNASKNYSGGIFEMSDGDFTSLDDTNYAITNYGTIKFSGGTIKGEKLLNNDSSSECIITGGKLISTSTSGYNIFASGKLTISGGEIQSAGQAISLGKNDLIFEGGDIKSGDGACAIANNGNTTGKLIMTGGTIYSPNEYIISVNAELTGGAIKGNGKNCGVRFWKGLTIGSGINFEDTAADIYLKSGETFTVNSDFRNTASVKIAESLAVDTPRQITTAETDKSMLEKITSLNSAYSVKYDSENKYLYLYNHPNHTCDTTKWESDEESHWHICSKCDDQVDKAAHTWKINSEIPATEENAGSRESECTVCAAVKTEELQKLPHTHNLTHHERIEPKCLENGAVEYWSCSKCGKNYSDIDGTNEITVTVIAAKGHTEVIDAAVAPTCTTAGKTEGKHCSVCETVITPQTEVEALGHKWDDGRITVEPTEEKTGVKTFTCTACRDTREETLAKLDHVHTWSTTYSSDETHHWLICTKCGENGERKDPAEHTWDNGAVTTEPTCTENGVKTYTCTVCDRARTEPVTAVGHKFGEWKNDETKHWQLCEGCGTAGNGAEHVWDAGTVTVQPTETATGEKVYKCTVCGKSRTEEIPVKLPTVTKDEQTGANAPDTSIETPVEELTGAVLEPEEQKKAEQGAKVEIILKVNDGTNSIPAEDKTKVEEEISDTKGCKLGQYLDVSLLKVVDGEEKPVTETNALITISFEIPTGIRGERRTFSVIRVHDGVTDVLPDIDDDVNTVTVLTDKFSTYALVYSERSSGVSAPPISSGSYRPSHGSDHGYDYGDDEPETTESSATESKPDGSAPAEGYGTAPADNQTSGESDPESETAKDSGGTSESGAAKDSDGTSESGAAQGNEDTSESGAAQGSEGTSETGTAQGDEDTSESGEPPMTDGADSDSVSPDGANSDEGGTAPDESTSNENPATGIAASAIAVTLAASIMIVAKRNKKR